MKHVITATVAGLAGLGFLAGSGLLLAQQQPASPQPEPPPAPGMQQQVEVSDADVRKFAEIYVEIEETRSELSAEMSQAEDRQDAQEIQGRLQEEVAETIEDHGWSIARYNRIANTISNDEELRDQAIGLIEEMGAG